MEIKKALKSLKEFAYTKNGSFSVKEAKIILQVLDNSINKDDIKEKMKNIIDEGITDTTKSVENIMFRQGYYKALEELLEKKR